MSQDYDAGFAPSTYAPISHLPSTYLPSVTDNSRAASVTSEELNIVSQAEASHNDLKERSRSPMRGRGKHRTLRSRVSASLTRFDYAVQPLVVSVLRRSLLVSTPRHIPTCSRCLTPPFFQQMLNLGLDAWRRSHLRPQQTTSSLRLLPNLRVLLSLHPSVRLPAGMQGRARTPGLLAAKPT